jgi:hypothetical protein
MNESWIFKLAAIAAFAPSADNSQPWILRWNGEELSVGFRVCDQPHKLFSAGSHATLIAAGAVVEHLELALAANDIPANWL